MMRMFIQLFLLTILPPTIKIMIANSDSSLWVTTGKKVGQIKSVKRSLKFPPLDPARQQAELVVLRWGLAARQLASGSSGSRGRSRGQSCWSATHSGPAALHSRPVAFELGRRGYRRRQSWLWMSLTKLELIKVLMNFPLLVEDACRSRIFSFCFCEEKVKLLYWP